MRLPDRAAFMPPLHIGVEHVSWVTYVKGGIYAALKFEVYDTAASS